MRVGDKVVCINGDFHPEIAKHFQYLPEKDKEYIIRAIRPMAAEGGILLEGLRNKSIFFKMYQGNLEPAFHSARFRLIDPIYNSIENEEYERIEEEVLLSL